MSSDPAGRAREPDSAADQPGVGVDDLQRLWAPWRFGYVGAVEPAVDGCPFCVLPARDPADDRDTLILHRGSGAYVICNAYPYNPGHLMVVPYAHESFLSSVDEDAAVEMWALARRCARVLHDRLGAEGVNLGMNLGAAGGAGIAEHVHLHAVPRWGGDTNFISTVGAARVLPRALSEVYDELADVAWV
ncbi:HIT family protein [Salsipaludibacter albus]|uniref:HIT family protein n=1 Tax=Salsipaludibacter albus TaxID=2849650 RepID=UPI001EE4A107